jgi:hypothetical protein
MPTTLFLRDRLGRKLTNGTPGTTQATDFLGVAVGSGTTDSNGCLLIAKKWAISTVTAIGDYTQATTGELLQATVGGTTSGTGGGPTAPGFGSTIVDGTVTWRQISTT